MTKRDGPRIAVVGAGLGGCIAAMFLLRFGYDVRVYEQAGRLEKIGAGIGLTPNATRICNALGLLTKMKRVGSTPRERYSRDGASGTLTLEVPIDEYERKYDGPHIVMRRGDLHDVFVGEIPPERLHVGKRLLDLTEAGAAMRLSFADGTTAEADIVIGADGVNSRVRQTAVDDQPSSFSGEVAHRATYPRALLGDMQVAEMTKWFVGGDKYVMVFFLDPQHQEVYFVTGYPQGRWTEPTYAPVETGKAELLACFADFCEDVRRILSAAPETTVWPICERDPSPGWSRGSVVLLGDACHAMRPHMGQGAAMAIEDAAVLARCVERYGGGSPAESFALYERLRFERTSRILLGSRGNTWMRDGMDVDWLYGYDAVNGPLSPEPSKAAP